jgi:hypothetical protein
MGVADAAPIDSELPRPLLYQLRYPVDLQQKMES